MSKTLQESFNEIEETCEELKKTASRLFQEHAAYTTQDPPEDESEVEVQHNEEESQDSSQSNPQSLRVSDSDESDSDAQQQMSEGIEYESSTASSPRQPRIQKTIQDSDSEGVDTCKRGQSEDNTPTDQEDWITSLKKNNQQFQVSNSLKKFLMKTFIEAREDKDVIKATDDTKLLKALKKYMSANTPARTEFDLWRNATRFKNNFKLYVKFIQRFGNYSPSKFSEQEKMFMVYVEKQNIHDDIANFFKKNKSAIANITINEDNFKLLREFDKNARDKILNELIKKFKVLDYVDMALTKPLKNKHREKILNLMIPDICMQLPKLTPAKRGKQNPSPVVPEMTSPAPRADGPSVDVVSSTPSQSLPPHSLIPVLLVENLAHDDRTESESD